MTGDRDEHIRISVYPETEVIHAMGLGHAAFLSAFLPVDRRVGRPAALVSGAGDRKVIRWDLEGRIVAEGRIQEGTCVRCIRGSGVDRLFVVGEGLLPFFCMED